MHEDKTDEEADGTPEEIGDPIAEGNVGFAIDRLMAGRKRSFCCSKEEIRILCP